MQNCATIWQLEAIESGLPDEPQFNGRAESTTGRIKPTTRTILQEQDAGLGEWALAAKQVSRPLTVLGLRLSRS